MLADDLCVNYEGDGLLAQMVSLYEEYQCPIVAIEEVPQNQTHNYGVIAGEEILKDVYKISEMVEKPSPRRTINLAIIGRYIHTGYF